MTVELARWIVGACGAYLAVGAVFAPVFLTLGVGRIDAAAKAMPWSARLLVFPGLAALWPLMLMKWLTRRQPPLT